jgi:hypothetical protein
MEQKNRNEIGKLYYSQLIVVWAIRVCIIGFAILSVFSLMQTESSYQPMNDGDMNLFGFQFGLYISIVLALVTQYIQNVALYAKKHMCVGDVVFESELPFIGKFKLTDRKIADFVFWASAGIDALTNVIWFYLTVEISWDILGIMIAIVGYTMMILLVFVEEGIGFLLDAHKKANRQLKDIAIQQNRLKEQEEKEAEREEARRIKMESQEKSSSQKRPDFNSNRQHQTQQPVYQAQGKNDHRPGNPSYQNPPRRNPDEREQEEWR